jgi:hypothetical protein
VISVHDWPPSSLRCIPQWFCWKKRAPGARAGAPGGGRGAGGPRPPATSDAVPYGLLGVVCAATLAGVIGLGRGAAARSPAAR